MDAHQQKQEDRIEALEKGQDRILAILEPMADTYKTASTLGKWIMGFLVFLSILLGTILAIKDLHK